MKPKDPKPVTVLAATMAKYDPMCLPYAVAIDAGLLCRIGRALDALNVKACERPLTTRDEKRWHTLARQAERIAKAHDFQVITQRDPRGAALRVAHGTWPVIDSGLACY